MNEYIKIYTHLGLETYKDWIKNIFPNAAGAHYLYRDNRMNLDYQLNERYFCHYYGKPRSTAGTMERATKPLSNRSQPRPIQKPSKRVGCKSYLHILKHHNEKGDSVRIIYYILHNGHNPGAAIDL